MKAWLKNNTVLAVAALLAAASVCLTPPSAAYLGYVDWHVLALLFCLMAVVVGLRRSGGLDHLSRYLLSKVKSTRALVLVLMLLSFFSAQLLTNDVALLTFVPLAVAMIDGKKQPGLLIDVIVLQTMAANLGSMITPVGNPQNLFLFSYYGMGIGDFLRLTLPIGLLCLGFLLAIIFIHPWPHLQLQSQQDTPATPLDRHSLIAYLALFALCLLAVVKLIPWQLMLAAVLLSLLIFDRRVLKEVDYALLLTFLCFFIFVGNVAAWPAAHHFIATILQGRVLLVSALLSQLISNVPAAVMLASFTQESTALLLGVNIGGLGTLVASLASLISYRLYCGEAQAQPGRYLKVFTAYNFSGLALLLAASRFIFAF
ncbi:MAG: anion permease [Firmicutes bacterium]|nr:anion permease [Bacillota bacterium]